jgi:hypothetical protein
VHAVHPSVHVMIIIKIERTNGPPPPPHRLASRPFLPPSHLKNTNKQKTQVSTAACILQDKTHRPGVSVALDVEMLGPHVGASLFPRIIKTNTPHWAGHHHQPTTHPNP